MVSRRVTRTTGWLAAAMLATAALTAQQQGADATNAVHGTLVVWMIGPPQQVESNLQAINDLHHATPLTYQESNAASFGQNSASFGQTSGSYSVPSDTPSISAPQSAPGQDAPSGTPNGIGYQEQTSGSFGQSSSNVGTEASDHGRAASNYGQTASNYGQTASSYGQTASTVGNASSTPAGVDVGKAKASSNRSESEMEGIVGATYPQIQMRFLEVPINELKDMLTVVKGTEDYPDLLVGPLPTSWGADVRAQYLLPMIRPAGYAEDGLPAGDQRSKFSSLPPVTITARAPHMELARLLLMWMGSEGRTCGSCSVEALDEKARPAARAALQAVSLLLRGEGLGGTADPQMARFSAQLGRSMLVTTANTVADGSVAQVRVLDVRLNGSVAVVWVSVVESTNGVFGVANPLVVVRRSADGQWRVLHVSLNLPGSQDYRIGEAMQKTDPTATAERAGGVVGVSLASPPDGDVRSKVPQLGWDNGGGAGLQVVEWQQAFRGGWSDAQLFLVPDLDATLKTQVAAEFATAATTYRWRVWSVGAAGAMKISPWRTFSVTQ